jgi:hypothetical protein
MIITFITILAWIFGVLSTGFTLLRIIASMMYSELDKMRDNIRGITVTYPIKVPGAIAIICWAWIISTWMAK